MRRRASKRADSLITSERALVLNDAMGSKIQSQKHFTVAIIGGGIGGLALAIGLLRRNVPVQIYEAATAFRETGLGLSIGPAAHRALPLIDPMLRVAYDSLVTTNADSPGFERFRDTWFEVVWASGEASGQVMMDLKALPSGQTTLRRADFLAALVEMIPQDIAHFDKRLVALQENVDGVRLSFEDGTSVDADIVVGCDGIKSKVKEFMLPEEVEKTRPTYSGMYCYRAVLGMQDAVSAVGNHRARVATWYIGNGCYAITYPIMNGKKLNFGMYKLDAKTWDSDGWVRPAAKEDLNRDMGHMGSYVNELMKHVSDTSQWAIFEHPPVSSYSRSRVAILGDAAHASTPHQGAGAGQAIEDAYVLAELLADDAVETMEDVVAAFKAYDSVRRPRSQKVVTSSKENAELLCLCHKGIGNDGEKLRQSWDERFQWLWNLDLDEHIESGRAQLYEYMRHNKTKGQGEQGGT
ncbi:Salicylate 1-monooxygenase [Purpureocillium takamizusanense]|uniref:Salicylate 1-monooxygenase n=1 Tax=Purpureocillium takamizusanense TaxID=2060973 RepID=A0A9Q8VGE5_9HYPO|nr:Salicylate 1-monooxygenase [Purpureocillium takamizusanense]UNI24558.1 Salicylate 1-monooxygenase [Purpureocillium takamizusanense]